MLVIKEMKYIIYDNLYKLNRPHVIITLCVGVVEYYIHVQIYLHIWKDESKLHNSLQKL